MKYLGKITDPKDLVTKEYVDSKEDIYYVENTVNWPEVVAAYRAGKQIFFKWSEEEGDFANATYGQLIEINISSEQDIGLGDNYLAFVIPISNGDDLKYVLSTWNGVTGWEYKTFDFQPYKGQITTTTSWSGNGPYTQTVTISPLSIPISAQTKVDLQPNAAAISQLINDGVEALYIENNNGVLTAYAVGAAPTTSLTLQVTVTEVAG